LRIVQYLLQGQLGHLVKAAPNLESLSTSTFLKDCDLEELLPLSKSLRKIQINNDDPWAVHPRRYETGKAGNHGCSGDVDRFVAQMPLLEAWYFAKGSFRLVNQPEGQNMHLLDPVEFWTGGHGYEAYNLEYLCMQTHDRNHTMTVFQDIFIHWFLGLKEEDKHRPEMEVVFEDIARTHFYVPDLMCVSNIGNKTVRKDILKDFRSKRRDVLRNARELHSCLLDVERHFWKRRMYVKKRRALAKLQERHAHSFDVDRSGEYDLTPKGTIVHSYYTI